MNKRGFTLVELLAVIIILSLLALLTSTAITKLVGDAKNDLNSTQIDLIKSAAQTWGADNLTGLPEAGKCSYLTVKDLKNYGLLNSNLKDLNTNENISDDLKIKISTTSNEKSHKLITTYEVDPVSVDGCYKQVYNDGDIVYFNVTTGKSCTDYTELQSATGVKSGCMKFYAFLDSGRKLNLLLDHNTSASLVYDDETSAADHVKQLYNDTKNWEVPYITKNYTVKSSQSINEILGNIYGVEYTKIPSYEGATSPFKARNITAQEIAKITGADIALNWSETTMTGDSDYYLDGRNGTDPKWDTQIANSTNKSEYYWLFDRTQNCTTYGCINSDSNTCGYFTETLFLYENMPHLSWIVVNNLGFVSFMDYPTGSTNYGIRPVIEVLKSNLQ